VVLTPHYGNFFVGRENSSKRSSEIAYELKERFYSHLINEKAIDTIQTFHNKFKQEIIDYKIDFDTFDTISILKKDSLYYTGNYIFHPGLLLKVPHFSVFRFVLTKK